ncbi:MAG TPA: tail fiber protein [Pyrinomonadaceae bacterium]|nr:tail fiber protein [Pyrinomonadaceae bacterium]
MGTPYMGEIKMISWNFAPKGWAFCDGQLLPINQNQALFSIMGTTYGGNGQTTFGLPDLRGRTPVYIGGTAGFTLGEVSGETAHTLTSSEMPAHIHFANAGDAAGTQPVPNGAYLARNVNLTYSAAANLTPLAPTAVSNVGGSQPHDNMMPYLVINFIVALVGVFPSRN